MSQALPRSGLLLLSLLFLIAGSPAGADATDRDASRLRQLLESSHYDQAAALARISIEAAPLLYGEDSIEEARLLDALVQALYRGGHALDPEGVEAANRALEIKNRRTGPDSREVATSLMQLGNLYLVRRDLGSALTSYDRAVEILESLRARGDEEVERDLAVILSNVGIVYRRRGDYEQSSRVAQRALAIRTRSLGADHPDLATSYNNIANIFTDLGKYEEARASHEEALRIREVAYGPRHEVVAESLNNLATVLGYMGEYDEALAAQERALSIFTETLGPDNDRTWTVRFNLAVLESEMGDMAGAQKDYEESLGRIRERFGERSIEAVEIQDALAEALRAQGELSEARDLYELSLSIYESHYGNDTDTVDYTLQGLGKVLTESGDYDRGREVLERSLAIREGYGDLESPELCDALHALAELDLAEGRYDQAMRLAQRSARIIESRLGSRHPLMAEAQSIMSRAECGRGEFDRGFVRALQAEATSREHLRETMGVLSESLALDYAAHRLSSLDLALSLLGDGGNGEAAAAWDAVIRSRALILDEMAARNRVRSGDRDSETVALRDRSRTAREQLANLSLRGPGWEDPATYRKLLDRARGEAEAADRAIALAIGDRRGLRKVAGVGLDEVRAALDSGHSLVAFVRHAAIDPLEANWHHARNADAKAQGAYRAFVLRDENADVVTVDLGDANTIDHLIQRWREAMIARPATRARGFSRVVREDAEDFDDYEDCARRLRRKVWDPLRPALGRGVSTVFVVPDGALHLLNFGALVEEDGSFLIEGEKRLWLLSTERALSRSRSETPVSERLLIVGDPDYAAQTSADSPRENPRPALMDRSDCLDAAELHFSRLPGARRESREVAELWRSIGLGTDKVELLQGADARESRVKAAVASSVRRPNVLHFATHGFFVGEECDRSEMRRTNPLVLSGLAFAGADHWRTASSGEDDGLLTAEEVAGLNLAGVDLVVLSACDTGLGEVRARGEGVFGLRRALQVAGARSVVMSLWPVGDEVGYRFMSAFYRARFGDGRSLEEALRSTSLGLLQSARTRGVPPHPRDWAAFVAVGEWQ